MSTNRRRGRAMAALVATALLGGLLTAVPAQAGPASDRADVAADCSGRSVPASKISFQMYSYWGWQRDIGTEAVLAELAEIGYRNVEPFGATYEGRSAQEFRALLKEYGLKAPSSHGSVGEDGFDVTLEFAKELGQRYVGSGGWAGDVSIARDGSSTYADAVEVAETLNRLGEMSVRNGTGKVFGHNHYWEFTTQVTDPQTGETISAWEVIAETIDTRWVTLQLDVYWAQVGGYDPAALIEEYGDRIELLHIKDGTFGEGNPFQNITDVGEGEVDWESVLEAAQGKVRYYVIERDGAPADAEFARDSFEFLTCFSY